MEQGPWSEYAPQPQTKPSGPWDEYSAPVNQSPSQTYQSPATSTHGALYNASDSVLNSPLPGKTDSGHPMLDQIGDSLKSLNPIDMGRGIVKGALSTAAGVGSIVNKLTGAQQPFNQSNLSGLTDANNAGQGIGKYEEQIAEFATGEGGVAKTADLVLPKLASSGLAKFAMRTGGAMAASGAVSGVQSGGDAASTILGTALPAFMSAPAAKVAGKVASEVLGKTTGAGEAAIARAFLHPDSSGLVKAMRGEINPSQIVDNLQNTVKGVRDAAGDSYKQTLSAISNQSVPGWHAKAGQALQDINDTLTTQLKKFGVIESQGKNGTELDMKHLTGATPEEVKNLVETVRNWGSEARDLTPGGLDTLKKKIGDVVGDTNSALANRVYDTAKQKLNTIIPGYESMTADYVNASDLLRTMKKEFNVTPGGNDNAGVVSRKIQNMLKQNTTFREDLMNKLPGGSELLDQIAGLHLNANLPKGILGQLLGAGSFFGGGALLHNPASIPAIAAASPRLVGEGARIAGKIAQSGLPVRDTARRAVTAGANGMLSGSN